MNNPVLGAEAGSSQAATSSKHTVQELQGKTNKALMVSRHKSLLTHDLIVPKLQNIDTAPPATRRSCSQSYIPMRLVHFLMESCWLQDLLKERGLSTKGKKEELVKRILDAK